MNENPLDASNGEKNCGTDPQNIGSADAAAGKNPAASVPSKKMSAPQKPDFAVRGASQAWKDPAYAAANLQGSNTGFAAAGVQKKSNAPLIVTIMLLALLIVACVASCVSGTAGSSATIPIGNRVAVITLQGTIQYDGSACSPDGFKMLLDEAENDPTVKALVLRVDSGGGVAAAGEEMTEYLKGFSKPVVVSTASVNASAAYEISSQADYIFAGRASEVGSIGTAIELTDFSGLYDLLGINKETIASADSKDSTYGNRALTESEKDHYQQMVDEINQMFIENVAEGRDVSVEQVSKWANGMTWAGETSLEMGLIDEIGTLDDALDKAAELGGCEDSYETTELYFESSELDNLLGLL